MFYDLGSLSFDEEQRRYVYEEVWECDEDPLKAWMIETLFDPYKVSTPFLISEVRYAGRRFDPKAMETKVEDVVILGTADAGDYDQMRSTDHLESDEIRIEITEGFMTGDIKITLLEEISESIEILSCLRMFVEQRKYRNAA